MRRVSNGGGGLGAVVVGGSVIGRAVVRVLVRGLESGGMCGELPMCRWSVGIKAIFRRC